jgi:hypothetical protein
MAAMLSDGSPVPVTTEGWADAMRQAILALHRGGGISDVGDLRKLLAARPLHYLGRDWEDVIGDARAFVARVDQMVPRWPFDLRPTAVPLVPAVPNAREPA